MFDILYPKFVTDWKKRTQFSAVYKEMEEDLESPWSHKSLSPMVMSTQLESSRLGRDCGVAMPPLSPLPARGASYTDQCGEANGISKTILGVSSGDPLTRMKYVAKFLQSMPGNDREYMRDTGALPSIDSYATANWRNGQIGEEKLNPSFSTREREFSSSRDRDFVSDGYSSEGTKDDSVQPLRPNDSDVNRCPRTDGKMSENVGGGREDEKHHKFQDYLKSQTGGYDLDALDAESRYHSPYGKKFGMVPTSLKENPLAAMLQKFAVSGDDERFSASPLKNIASITTSLFAGKGLPKKRRYQNDMIFPPAGAYGLPPVRSSGVVSLGAVETGSNRPDVFICHICSFVATSNEDFKAHMTIHYDYQCPQCTYSSRTEGRLKRHIKDFHGTSSSVGGQEESPDGRQSQKANQPKKFKCRQCHSISYSREEHWRHLAVHIKKEKQLKCIHCPFVTEFKHHLEYHMRNHNNSKPYKCNKCNYTCVNKSMLNSHMKSHTNVYQFRCASCKYATKYSHSLKLHLINKKHLPAVVLNPDGSLPTDGCGNFDLLSKRGPPRGPRGPRKPKLMTGDMNQRGMLPVFPPGSSPLMSFAHESEYPWIPTRTVTDAAIPGNLPINGTLFSTAGTPSSQYLGYPLNIIGQLSGSVAQPDVGRPSDGVASPAAVTVRCSFCPAVFHSLMLLSDHVKVEHVQKLGGFGVKLEAKSPTSQDPSEVSYPGGSLCEKISTEEAICHAQGLNSKPEASMFPSRNVEIPPEIEMKTKSASETIEIPLDLSSKNSDDVKPTAVKRSAVEVEEEDTSNAISLSVTAISRKRSRKGKACKLDVLSLKLQDHWREEDGLLDGSESSSLDGECLPGLGGSGAVKESERKCSEVGCHTSSPPPPPLAAMNDGGSWKQTKESAQRYLDADGGDQQKGKTDVREQNLKPSGFSGQEPASDNSNTNGSCSASSAPTRRPPDNGYYTCNYCDMGFRDNVTHFLHMGYHTYNDPFKCNKCGHRSADAVDFFVHMARVAHTQ